VNPIRSAKVLLRDRNGRVLVLRRSDTHPRHPLYPDLPGGDIEAGESLEEGVTREILEETGLVTNAQDLQLVYATTVAHSSGDSITHILYVLETALDNPKITISWEHDSYEWQLLHELTGLEDPHQTGINYIRTQNILK
jgi:8-oxo-dGTP pyrophosphatase MutT (NUDIX family)